MQKHLFLNGDPDRNMELLYQSLVNSNSLPVMRDRANKYLERCHANIAKGTMAPRDNRGEMFQYRVAIDQKKKDPLAIFDIDILPTGGAEVIDWNRITDPSQISPAHSVLALDTTHLKNSEAPVLLLFLSSQSVINDFISLGAQEYIASLGLCLAVFEYPGTGTSLGSACRKNWTRAGAGAVRLLAQMAGRKVFALGHSIGGNVAFDLINHAEISSSLAGVISYGGFYSLLEVSKSQKDWGCRWFNSIFNPSIVALIAPTELYHAGHSLSLMAPAGVPALIMHSRNDATVPYGHQNLFQKKIEKIHKQHPNAHLKTLSYDDFQHEGICEFGQPAFEKIWQDIRDFSVSSSYFKMQDKRSRLSPAT
jgi:dienelactone hydrolase